jgi:hypothetical protein
MVLVPIYGPNPLAHEAAARIEALEAKVAELTRERDAERERCAKVAESSPDSHWGPTIAAAIRKGATP